MSVAVHLTIFAGLIACILAVRLTLDWVLKRGARPTPAAPAIEDPQNTPRRAA